MQQQQPRQASKCSAGRSSWSCSNGEQGWQVCMTCCVYCYIDHTSLSGQASHAWNSKPDSCVAVHTASIVATPCQQHVRHELFVTHHCSHAMRASAHADWLANTCPISHVLVLNAIVYTVQCRGLLSGVDDGCEPTPEEVAAGVAAKLPKST